MNSPHKNRTRNFKIRNRGLSAAFLFILLATPYLFLPQIVFCSQLCKLLLYQPVFADIRITLFTVTTLSGNAMANQQDSSGSIGAGHFDTTQWSLVLAAREDRSQSELALAQLCQTYWYPLYAFVRRKGHQPAEAQDLTQGFFASLLEKKYLADADPDRGRFRSFLLTAFRHYVSDAKKYQSAKKRGGDRITFSLDFEKAERSYLAEPHHFVTAEKLFERQWAITLLDSVLARLRQEYVDGGKSNQFEELKGVLTGSDRGPDFRYRDIGARLNMSEDGVKVLVYRMRQRFRELLKAEIAETVTGPEEVQEELRALFNLVRG